MSFTEPKFLIFFPIVFLGYYLIPKKWQWAWLLVASVAFYAFFAWWAMLFLVGTLLLSYFGANILSNIDLQKRKELSQQGVDKKQVKAEYAKKQSLALTLVLIALLLVLVIPKYTRFFVETICDVFQREAPVVSLVMPVGLSFYIFQAIGYVIDVHRGQYEAERNFLRYASVILYFPHILQGPLDPYEDLSKQIFAEHSFEEERTFKGIFRMVWGYMKKTVVAGQAIVVYRSVLATGGVGYDGLTILFAMLLYALWIYADFSGYMDIAIGASTVLDIRISENFDAPYFSGSIEEYWRRWHSTLGTWFKNYVFYSVLRTEWCSKIRKNLKKNKFASSTVPTCIALLITWTLIGFWHGSAWSFVVHGLLHGGIIILSTCLSPVYDKVYVKFPNLKTNALYRAFRVARTFFIVYIGYFFFASESLGKTFSLFAGISHIDFKAFLRFGFGYTRELFSMVVGTALFLFEDIYHVKHPELPLWDKVVQQKAWKKYLLLFLLVLFVMTFRSFDKEAISNFAYFRF